MWHDVCRYTDGWSRHAQWQDQFEEPQFVPICRLNKTIDFPRINQNKYKRRHIDAWVEMRHFGQKAGTSYSACGDRSEDNRGKSDNSGVEQRAPGGLADERGDRTVRNAVLGSLVVNTPTRPVAQDQHDARLVHALPKGLGEVRCANHATHGSTLVHAAGSASRSMQRDGTGRVPKTR